MHKWFPANATVSFAGSGQHELRPRARIICFHGAATDSMSFTSKGTANKPMPNPLMAFCFENDVQLLAVHLPGRTSRRHETCLTSAKDYAAQILDLYEENLYKFSTRLSPSENNTILDDIPLVVAAHSMGTFIAYEFVCQIRARRRIPLPKHLILSCMVSPSCTVSERPWKPVGLLDSDELKEECIEWGANSAIFHADIWSSYEPILRSDLNIIDEFKPFNMKENPPSPSTCSSSTNSPQNSQKPTDQLCTTACSTFYAPLQISTTMCYAKLDRKITRDHVLQWESDILGSPLFRTSQAEDSNETKPTFNIVGINGGHNFFQEADGRVEWMQLTIAILDQVLIEIEYGLC